jgi:hypothetical protein
VCKLVVCETSTKHFLVWVSYFINFPHLALLSSRHRSRRPDHTASTPLGRPLRTATILLLLGNGSLVTAVCCLLTCMLRVRISDSNRCLSLDVIHILSPPQHQPAPLSFISEESSLIAIGSRGFRNSGVGSRKYDPQSQRLARELLQL